MTFWNARGSLTKCGSVIDAIARQQARAGSITLPDDPFIRACEGYGPPLLHASMIRQRQLMVAVLAFGFLAGGAAASRAEAYSAEQMELAGKIGAVVAMSRICTGTVPTTAVVKVLEANGLTESDVLGNTPIRERMQHEASTVMQASKIRRDSGEPQAEVVRSACKAFQTSLGPDGILAPGLSE